MTKAPKFHVGQVVAYVETWPKRRVICLAKVTFVGKRDVRIGDRDRFKVENGASWSKSLSVRWRAIEPLTPKVIAEAKEHGAGSMELANT